MLEKLIPAAERRAGQAVERQIERLAQSSPPPGVTVEPFDGGIRLTGKRIRRRLITDPQLRNFGR